MRKVSLGMVLALSVGALALILTTPKAAEAFIHEIIAAACRASGEDVEPPGQIKPGNSFIRALQATGFITSIVATPTLTTINFDPTIPASKFMSAGRDLLIPDPDGPGPQTALLLHPLVVPNEDFPAHAACHNLR